MNARRVFIKLVVTLPVLIVILLSSLPSQALSGALVCFEDIPGNSVIPGFEDCILANRASLTVKNRKPPFCTVRATYDIGAHSPILALRVNEKTLLEPVRVVFFSTGAGGPPRVPYELELKGFIAKKVKGFSVKKVMTGAEDDSPFREQITLIPQTGAVITVTSRVFNEDLIPDTFQQDIKCDQ